MLNGKLGDFKVSDAEMIKAILRDAETQMREAEAELDYCDRKTQDLLHEMELMNLSYHENARLSKELVDIRRRRRIAKNAIDLLSPLVGWKSDQAGPLAKLDNAIGKMRQINEKQLHAVYIKRADDAGTIIATGN